MNIIKSLNKKKKLFLLYTLFLFILIYPVNAELLEISCYTGSCSWNSGWIVIPDYETSTTIRDCPDSVICCSTRINQDIRVDAEARTYYTGLQSWNWQVFPKFSSCGGGNCGYLNDCTGQCILRSGNSCFDGQTTCSGYNYLTCSGCQWRDNGIIAGQCGVASNYGQLCGQCGGTIRLDGSCSVPTPSNYGQSCTVGIGACQRTGTIQCDGSCSATPGTPTTEICDNLDNDCDGIVDEGCDDDSDNYCDANIQIVGTPSTCTAGGNDCNDNSVNINPGIRECCDFENLVDENCNGQINEICDRDNDGFIDTNAPLCVSTSQITESLAQQIVNIIRQILGI